MISLSHSHNHLEALEDFDDKYGEVTVTLLDSKVAINRLYLILMSDLMREVMKDVEHTRLIIPQITEQNFNNLIEILKSGKVFFQSQDEVTEFLEDIKVFGFKKSQFDQNFIPSFNILEEKDSAEKVLGHFHSNIDRFEVDDITCTYCLAEFSSKQCCENHQEICTKNPDAKTAEFNCSECDSSFYTKNGLKSHIDSKHRFIDFHSCGSCKKKYKHLSDLKRHCTTQGHTYPFSEGPLSEKEDKNMTWCKGCFRFIKTENFDDHQSKHKTEFKCDMCDFLCNRRDNLDRHKKLHHNAHNVNTDALDDNFTAKMSYCGQDNTWKKLTATRKLTYTCPKCKKKFQTKEDIGLHLSLKNCEEHKCNLCNIEFTLKSNYKRHMKKFHGNTKP